MASTFLEEMGVPEILGGLVVDSDDAALLTGGFVGVVSVFASAVASVFASISFSVVASAFASAFTSASASASASSLTSSFASSFASSFTSSFTSASAVRASAFASAATLGVVGVATFGVSGRGTVLGERTFFSSSFNGLLSIEAEVGVFVFSANSGLVVLILPGVGFNEAAFFAASAPSSRSARFVSGLRVGVASSFAAALLSDVGAEDVPRLAPLVQGRVEQRLVPELLAKLRDQVPRRQKAGFGPGGSRWSHASKMSDRSVGR